MRLGFAVAINVDPDVLLVDEVLAVGDQGFTHKCLDKFAEFRRRGRTVLLVTHSLDMVTRFCDEALWLDAGHARVTAITAAGHRRVPGRRRAEASSGTGRPRRTSPTSDIEIARRAAARRRRASPADTVDSGERRQHPRRRCARVATSRRDSLSGWAIFNADGVRCCGTDTRIEGAVAERVGRRGRRSPAPSTVSISWLALTPSIVAVHQRRRHDVRPRPSPRIYRDIVASRTSASSGHRTGGRLPAGSALGSAVTQCSSMRPSLAARIRTRPNEAAAFARGVQRARRHRGVHERRLRSAAPRPRPLSREARALGDALIVGVNTDRSVRGNKGTSGQSCRSTSAPKCSWRSAAWTRSSSSTRTRRTPSLPPFSRTSSSRAPTGAPDNIVGRDVVEARGGRVVRVQLSAGFRRPSSSRVRGLRRRTTRRRRSAQAAS